MKNLILVSTLIVSSYSWAQSQDNSPSSASTKETPKVNAPKDLKVVDPFARGLTKPTAYGTIPTKSNINPTHKDSVETTPDNLRQLSDIRSYRLVGINSRRSSDKPIFVGPDLSKPAKGQSPAHWYIRLGSYNQTDYAKQYAWDFFQNNREFIDANFVLRPSQQKKKNVIHLDYGPFDDLDYTKILCQHLTRHITPPVSQCPVVKELRSREETLTNNNTAIIGLSAGMIYSLSESDLYDPKKLMGATFKVKEGDVLGAEAYTVLKIQKEGIYLAKPNSQTFFLSIDTLPFDPPESKKDDKPKTPPSGNRPAG